MFLKANGNIKTNENSISFVIYRWWSAFGIAGGTCTNNGKLGVSRDVPNGKSSEINIK